MASSVETITYICDQSSGTLAVTARKMFGEYGLYAGGRMVAMVCDDRLFVKPVPEIRAYAPDLALDTPYPGAKPHLVVPQDAWDDADWMAGLVLVLAEALPPPKPKPKPKQPAR